MLPVGLLMVEHRLIERIISLMEEELRRIGRDNKLNPEFLDFTIDFLKTYADRCHHGKEEDILFKELARKALSGEHKKMMAELVRDHVFGRKTVTALTEVRRRLAGGDDVAIKDIAVLMKDLVRLYARHIGKEDNDFFLPAMLYFDKKEQQTMISSFRNFDQSLIQEVYKNAMDKWENHSF